MIRIGIAHLYLRLSQQLPDIELPSASFPALIRKHLPAELLPHSPVPGKFSPIGSTTGPAIAELAFQILFEEGHDSARFEIALHTIGKALNHACASEEEGGDEVLYGRAGLLWGALNLRKLIESEKGSVELAKQVGRIVTEDVIRGMVEKMMYCGRWGAQRYYVLKDEKLPLLWKWHNKPYLGASVIPSLQFTAHVLTVLASTGLLVSSRSCSNAHRTSSNPTSHSSSKQPRTSVISRTRRTRISPPRFRSDTAPNTHRSAMARLVSSCCSPRSKPYTQTVFRSPPPCHRSQKRFGGRAL